jgi:cation diffusion facilitator CzcD-associated flavoprotein CzcO
MFFSKEANDIIADYLKRKIRSTVNDPVVCRKLVPKTYPYGTKRQPLDSNYFETFNKRTCCSWTRAPTAHRGDYAEWNSCRWQEYPSTSS